jgi:hypothetical protein
MTLAKHRWISLETAALILGEEATNLRRKLERRASLNAEGIKEANLDGITARRMGKHWKLQLGSWDKGA